jgi:hypothetical protein
MEENQLLQELESIAEKLSISVRYDDLMGADFKVKGGLCKLKGENVIIMDKKMPPRERIDLLVRALSQFDLSPIFIKPYIRHLIGDDSRERDTGTPEGGAKTESSPSHLQSR